MASYAVDLTRARRRAHLCPGCGARPPRPRHNLCEPCIARKMRYCPCCELVVHEPGRLGGGWCRACQRELYRRRRGIASAETGARLRRQAGDRGRVTERHRADADPRNAEIIRLRDGAGLPWAEVAARVGLPETAAQARYYRALARRVARAWASREEPRP